MYALKIVLLVLLSVLLHLVLAICDVFAAVIFSLVDLYLVVSWQTHRRRFEYSVADTILNAHARAQCDLMKLMGVGL